MVFALETIGTAAFASSGILMAQRSLQPLWRFRSGESSRVYGDP